MEGLWQVNPERNRITGQVLPQGRATGAAQWGAGHPVGHPIFTPGAPREVGACQGHLANGFN